MKRLLMIMVSLIVTLAPIHSAQAGLIVEQYNDFWSTDVNQLIAYAIANEADATAMFDVIDFTDDPNGFSGNIAGSNRWPSAEEANADGTTHTLNQTFFARIYGYFSVATAGEYFFQTYNDDGVFVFVNNDLVINDPTLHPEMRFSGSKLLDVGVHFVELFFFENGGEASLEFTVSSDNSNFTHFFGNNSAFTSVDAPATLTLFTVALVVLYCRRKRS